MLNILEFVRCSYKQSAYKKFYIYPSLTLFPWNVLKPPKNVWYFRIYYIVLINKSAYNKLKQ